MIHALPIDPVTDEVLDLEPVRRIGKDLRQAAATLTTAQARYFVDVYYQLQEFRKASANQQRAAIEAVEPNDCIRWVHLTMATVEQSIKAALDTYTDASPLGRWAKSITGVGPVIAAGLLAHVDVEKAPTAGHIWRFAGLDPSQEWAGTAAAGELVRAARQAEADDHAALVWLAQATHRKPLLLYAALGAPAPTRAQVRQTLLDLNLSASLVDAALAERPIELASAIETACERGFLPLATPYAELYADVDVQWEAVRRALAKRPWNAKLKVLCFKIGESFIKFQNTKNDHYGCVYRRRKDWEAERNAGHEYHEQAEAVLEHKRIGKSTEAYGHYSDGRLPPAQIHARARRYATKLFLSHYHEVAYFLQYETLPPRPYVVAQLGHAHLLHPPNADLVPGLAEAHARQG